MKECLRYFLNNFVVIMALMSLFSTIFTSSMAQPSSFSYDLPDGRIFGMWPFSWSQYTFSCPVDIRSPYDACGNQILDNFYYRKLELTSYCCHAIQDLKEDCFKQMFSGQRDFGQEVLEFCNRINNSH